MTRILFSVLALYILSFGESVSQKQISYKELSEKELVNNLKSIDSELRYYSANEIKRRIVQNDCIVQEGNIIENTKDFWQKKVEIFRNMKDLNALLDSFIITSNNLIPNYDNIKRFRLDHFFGISVHNSSVIN